jgi:hypothetical protein
MDLNGIVNEKDEADNSGNNVDNHYANTSNIQ